MKPPMIDLIERLEKATGPDRELDEAIALLCAPTDDPRLAAFENGRDYPDLYTGSTDAALGLVPEGQQFYVGRNEWQGRLTPFACVNHGPERNAATPAIALCIAALRARAAMKPAQALAASESG